MLFGSAWFATTHFVCIDANFASAAVEEELHLNALLYIGIIEPATHGWPQNLTNQVRSPQRCRLCCSQDTFISRRCANIWSDCVDAAGASVLYFNHSFVS
jgi:hypothetical protein